jgi:hypothetical protein
MANDKRQLIRETFELTRDILFHRLKEQFFTAYGAIQKYPDPAVREQKMRDFHNDEHETTYAQYERMAMQDTVAGLTEHRDSLKRAIAHHGDHAWELFCDTKDILQVERRRAELELSPQERGLDPAHRAQFQQPRDPDKGLDR